MFSKRQEKLIRSLQRKKFRWQHRLFSIEGLKLLEEAMNSPVEIVQILSTEEYASKVDQTKYTLEILSEIQMQAISNLSTAPGVMAIVKIPQETEVSSKLSLYLDGISDPGNLGTIIRTAEGFGVSQLYLSPDCADLFSSKVVQASMGSIFRMNYCIKERSDLKSSFNEEHQFYAADMSGELLYDAKLITPAILVLGSESHGVSDEIREMNVEMIRIPISKELESYNVAISNAILLSEFKRRSLI